MEHAQIRIASRFTGKGQKGATGLRLHGYLTCQRGKWENTGDIIEEKFTEMVLFVSQVLEVGMNELWGMDYFGFLRLMEKADEVAESRLAQIEKQRK